MLALVNTGLEPVLKKGERVAQGIFYKYLTTDDDKDTKKKTGAAVSAVQEKTGDVPVSVTVTTVIVLRILQ